MIQAKTAFLAVIRAPLAAPLCQSCRYRLQNDGLGRLITVTDTLDRGIDLAYNADGFIESVTDFAGRQIKYEYYQDGDAGGTIENAQAIAAHDETV